MHTKSQIAFQSKCTPTHTHVYSDTCGTLDATLSVVRGQTGTEAANNVCNAIVVINIWKLKWNWMDNNGKYPPNLTELYYFDFMQ